MLQDLRARFQEPFGEFLLYLVLVARSFPVQLAAHAVHRIKDSLAHELAIPTFRTAEFFDALLCTQQALVAQGMAATFVTFRMALERHRLEASAPAAPASGTDPHGTAQAGTPQAPAALVAAEEFEATDWASLALLIRPSREHHPASIAGLVLSDSIQRTLLDDLVPGAVPTAAVAVAPPAPPPTAPPMPITLDAPAPLSELLMGTLPSYRRKSPPIARFKIVTLYLVLATEAEILSDCPVDDEADGHFVNRFDFAIEALVSLGETLRELPLSEARIQEVVSATPRGCGWTVWLSQQLFERVQAVKARLAPGLTNSELVALLLASRDEEFRARFMTPFDEYTEYLIETALHVPRANQPYTPEQLQGIIDMSPTGGSWTIWISSRVQQRFLECKRLIAPYATHAQFTLVLLELLKMRSNNSDPMLPSFAAFRIALHRNSTGELFASAADTGLHGTLSNPLASIKTESGAFRIAASGTRLRQDDVEAPPVDLEHPAAKPSGPRVPGTMSIQGLIHSAYESDNEDGGGKALPAYPPEAAAHTIVQGAGVPSNDSFPKLFNIWDHERNVKMLETLPREMVDGVLAHLNVGDLLVLAKVSRRLRAAALAARAWRASTLVVGGGAIQPSAGEVEDAVLRMARLRLAAVDLSHTRCATTASVLFLFHRRGAALADVALANCPWVEWDVVLACRGIAPHARALRRLDLSWNVLVAGSLLARFARARYAACAAACKRLPPPALPPTPTSPVASSPAAAAAAATDAATDAAADAAALALCCGGCVARSDLAAARGPPSPGPPAPAHLELDVRFCDDVTLADVAAAQAAADQARTPLVTANNRRRHNIRESDNSDNIRDRCDRGSSNNNRHYAPTFIERLFRCGLTLPIGSNVDLCQFIATIMSRTRLSSNTLVLAFLYLDRLKSMHPRCKGSPGSAHRLILSAIMLAAKFLYDDTFDNTAWATVSSGLFSLEQVNHMEMEMLYFLNFRLFVSQSEWQAFFATLDNDMEAWQMANVRATGGAASPAAPPAVSTPAPVGKVSGLAYSQHASQTVGFQPQNKLAAHQQQQHQLQQQQQQHRPIVQRTTYRLGPQAFSTQQPIRPPAAVSAESDHAPAGMHSTVHAPRLTGDAISAMNTSHGVRPPLRQADAPNKATDTFRWPESDTKPWHHVVPALPMPAGMARAADVPFQQTPSNLAPAHEVVDLTRSNDMSISPAVHPAPYNEAPREPPPRFVTKQLHQTAPLELPQQQSLSVAAAAQHPQHDPSSRRSTPFGPGQVAQQTMPSKAPMAQGNTQHQSVFSHPPPKLPPHVNAHTLQQRQLEREQQAQERQMQVDHHAPTHGAGQMQQSFNPSGGSLAPSSLVSMHYGAPVDTPLGQGTQLRQLQPPSPAHVAHAQNTNAHMQAPLPTQGYTSTVGLPSQMDAVHAAQHAYLAQPQNTSASHMAFAQRTAAPASGMLVHSTGYNAPPERTVHAFAADYGRARS
nr:hypothetical protein HK105_002136 [Polyrhizophydium stewartii]